MSSPIYYLILQSLVQRKKLSSLPQVIDQLAAIYDSFGIGRRGGRCIGARECPLDCQRCEGLHSPALSLSVISLVTPFIRTGPLLWVAAPTSGSLLQSLHPGGCPHNILSFLPLLDGWVVVFKFLTFSFKVLTF